MIFSESLPFIREYVQQLNEALAQQSPSHRLTRLQCYWLSFVLLGILVTNTVCFSRFGRFSLGHYSPAALSWMLRKAKITWDYLLLASVAKILEVYGIKNGILVIDDTDMERSKNTKRIAKVHTVRDKKHAGFFKGQEIVFLLLVTQKVTIPVGFCLYEPDPKQKEWRREDKRLRLEGIKKADRPKRPDPDPCYPSQKQLAVGLIQQFKDSFPWFHIKAAVADAFYDTKDFFDAVDAATGGTQIISQIRKNQKIQIEGKWVQAETYFNEQEPQTATIKLRQTNKQVTYCIKKCKVKSHDARYFVLAVKYDDESSYRYIIARDKTWLIEDILKAYATRWLVEVFIQDWKSYEGWSHLAMQQDLIGTERGLTVSLLCDHVLHFHEDQFALSKNNDPAATVGSLREKIVMQSLMSFIEKIVTSDDAQTLWTHYAQKVSELFQLRSSLKHMRGVQLQQIPHQTKPENEPMEKT